jgi:hypothetical protein
LRRLADETGQYEVIGLAVHDHVRGGIDRALEPVA